MALATRTYTPKKKTHIVDRTLAKLEGEERAWLEQHLANPDVTDIWISEQLKDEGIDVSDSSIADWRRRHNLRAPR